MKEKKDLREACVKCFENADHSVTAAVYGKPVHFMEEGRWRRIDNRLYMERSPVLWGSRSCFVEYIVTGF